MVPAGRFRGEFAWRNSAEVEAHLANAGRAAEPVCWMMVGYVSGYTSVFMGRPVIYRELACRACGARRCRIVGTTLGDGAPPPEFAFLAPGRAIDRGGARASQRWDRGDREGALADLDAGRQAYAAAVAIGESSPSVLSAMGELEYTALRMVASRCVLDRARARCTKKAPGDAAVAT